MKKMSRACASFAIFFLLIADIIGATEKIDINTASLTELVKIIHIGEARAQELISMRPFSSLDDLSRIKGIGIKRVEDIKKQGLAWIDPVAEIPQPEPLKTPETAENSPPQDIKENLINLRVAAAGEQAAESSSLLIAITAAILAALSGGTVLLLKKRLK